MYHFTRDVLHLHAFHTQCFSQQKIPYSHACIDLKQIISIIISCDLNLFSPSKMTKILSTMHGSSRNSIHFWSVLLFYSPSFIILSSWAPKVKHSVIIRVIVSDYIYPCYQLYILPLLISLPTWVYPISKVFLIFLFFFCWKFKKFFNFGPCSLKLKLNLNKCFI